MHIKDTDSKTTCFFCISEADGTLTQSSVEVAPDDSPEFRPGSILGERYLLERVLGRGGMGQVFAARDLRLERVVAIKVVRHHLTRAEELEQILAREARLGASLSHRGIAAVYDFGFQGPRSYTVFEFIEGETLRQILLQRQKLDLNEVLLIAQELALALDFAHAKGVIHRDLKPENICCSKSGELKILDLGLARDIHAEVESQRYSGTPAYSSPEQCACLPTDGKSDQYALALIVFEMLAGRQAFRAAHPMEMLRLHQEVPCPNIHQFAADLPEHIDRVLQRGLHKEPQQRYASCAEFARELAGPLAPAARSHMLSKANDERVHFYLAHAADLVPMARRLVGELSHKRFRSWLFCRDAIESVPAIKQCQQAIERAQAVLALISRSALRSADLARDMEYAHYLHVPVVPLLIDISLNELRSASPPWLGLLGDVQPVEAFTPDFPKPALEHLWEIVEHLQVMPEAKALIQTGPRNRACEGPAWATDANQIDIHSLDQVLFRNGAVDDFLRSRHKHFISAPKGFGKTLLLSCKRQMLAHSHESGGEARFIPEGRPFLDFMSELRSLSVRYEEPLSDLNNTKRWWSAALRVSAISHHPEVMTDDDQHELQNYPARISRWLAGGKVQPTVVFKELTSLSVRELNQFVDEGENFLDLKMRQIHGTSWFFIDKVDQAIRHLSREAWIAIQAGLIEAAWETMNANSHIKIYASIRQEAFTNYRSDIKSNLFSAITNLHYSETELRAILDQLAQCYEGCQSFADFLGLKVVNHAKRPSPEDSFKYLRRHTSGRPRDLVAIASALSPQRESLTDKELRSIVQQTSANVLVSNVFDEVRAFLNCLQDPDARLRLLSRMPANIVDKSEAIRICEEFNGLAAGTLHHFGEESAAIHHPFRDLYFTGLLGTLSVDPEESVTIQRFRRASDPLSSAAFDLPESPFYLIHPALDTFIRGQTRRGSFLQYQHITVGENLPWLEHYPLLMQVEKHLQGIDDPSFCQLAHEVIRHIQSILTSEPTRYARLQVEYSLPWQRLRSYEAQPAYTDAIFWINALLESGGPLSRSTTNA